MNKLLKKSLDESIPVEIIYQSKNDIFSKRVIQVKAMNGPYIKAYCHAKKHARIFRYESILAVVPVRAREERTYA
jgi:predicted DNA-binding transcriptional regulator YafY